MTSTKAQRKPPRAGSRGPEFKATLQTSPMFPLAEERNVGTLKLKGRIFRSPRAGYFVLQRTGTCCEGMALELRIRDIKDLDCVFTDSAGRSTYTVSVAAACPIKLVVPVADESMRPRATLGEASQGTHAWMMGPWWEGPAIGRTSGGILATARSLGAEGPATPSEASQAAKPLFVPEDTSRYRP
jgi:hypothetical protein